MKWTSHKIITGITVFMATKSVFCAIPAIVGSIFPDYLEGKPPNQNTDPIRYQEWKQKHRKLSHWFVPYFVVAVFFFVYIKNTGLPLIPTKWEGGYFSISRVVFFVCVGCLFHILQDAICGKVPSLNPNKRIGVKIFSVGSVGEYVITIIVVVVSMMSLAGKI